MAASRPSSSFFLTCLSVALAVAVGVGASVPSFDLQNRVLMYAYASFCDATPEARAQLKNWTCFWCEKVQPGVNISHFIQNDGDEGIFGFVGTTAAPPNASSRVSDRMVVLSFRGSMTIPNWETDFEIWENAFPDAAPGAAVHHGFWEAWLKNRQSVLDGVQREVDVLKKTQDSVEVLVTGHSLGGAMAAIASVELGRRYHGAASPPGVSVRMLNFGQPRVGNMALAKYMFKLFPLAGSHVRVINHRDIVPHLPVLLVGYEHAPIELWYADSYRVFKTCSPTNGEDMSCSDQYDVYDPADHIRYLGYQLHHGFAHGCGHP